MQDVFGGHTGADQDEWISVSDLMTGLMVIFLFVAVAFIINTSKENQEMKDIAVAWYEREEDIYRALDREFREDLVRWNAELVPESLIIRFRSPDVLFEAGSSELREKFQEVLRDFFPRYVKVLSQHRSAIEEIRIEGHTSSDWNQETSEEEAYYQNMRLSQDRTRTVLRYVMGMEDVRSDKEWLLERLTANGLSSSRLERDERGNEDVERSRRVEFRVRTNASDEIRKILEKVI